MVFISHAAAADGAAARSIRDALVRAGITCWLAPGSVPAGKDHAREIPRAINACEIFLLILSPATLESEYVRKEVEFAIRYRKTILAVTRPGFELDDRYDYLLSGVQFRPLNEDDLSEIVAVCALGEDKVNLTMRRSPERRLTVRKGDFQHNMRDYIAEVPQELDRTVFAMGVDRSGRLDLSSTGGILRWVLEMLEGEFGVAAEEVQRGLDRARREQLGHTDLSVPLQYKDCLLIPVPLGRKDQQGKPLAAQLLLIANSQKGREFDIHRDLDDVEGIDSREIILEVFNTCARLGERASTLFLGAMGTNGLSFPYEVITAEILNCYVFALRQELHPHHLCYSVRTQDMAAAGLTMDQIMDYIGLVTRFFQK